MEFLRSFFVRRGNFSRKDRKRQEEPGSQSLSRTGKGNCYALGFNFIAAFTVFRGYAD